MQLGTLIRKHLFHSLTGHLQFLQVQERMWRLLEVLAQNPLGSLKALYTCTCQTLLICLGFCLLPGLPRYQTLRQQIHKAYWASCSTYYSNIIHRLPVTRCPEERARRIGSTWTSYVIPGTAKLNSSMNDNGNVVILYAHGGGYARGEARMYLNYMERWQREASKVGLQITFVSVEYRM